MKKYLWRMFLVACSAFVLRACVFETVRTSDDSMMPTFAQGEVALVSKLSYGLRVPGSGAVIWDWSPPKVGDYVVCAGAGDPPVTILRKISAVPGDKVKLPDGGDHILVPGQYYVLAEQNENVVDSRVFGPISRRLIIGKARQIEFFNDQNASSGNSSKVESGNSQKSI